MTLLWQIKQRIKNNPHARVLIEERKRRRYTRYVKQYSDREFIERFYEQKVGRKPDLDDPKTFTEKLQWLKLNYRDPDIPRASDKYEAKQYIAERGFPELLIPTLAVYHNADEIDLSKLPDKFILKATHGSGWNFICRDKASFDLPARRKIMNAWLKQNLYIYGREWNYKEQTPRLIAEPLMDDKPLVDYKFLCFNGVCRALTVNHDDNGTHYIDFYDSDWNLIPEMKADIADHSCKPLPKPERFDEMKAIAEKLAAPFPFVRVDLYDIRGEIYFGEMTFFPGSGFWHITPETYDETFGAWLTLPESSR
ncbi:MAG: glycosyl transferase [Clostridia bacterium]|nr:glycosyl transferase [Clostridia bacterium]